MKNVFHRFLHKSFLQSNFERKRIYTCLNIKPYSDREERILPTPTLNVFNVFNKQAKATDLMTFPKLYLGTISIASSCLWSLKLPWRPLFDQRFVQNFEFPYFKRKIITFLKLIQYIFKNHWRIWITSWSILVVFEGFGKSRNPRWRIQGGHRLRTWRYILTKHSWRTVSPLRFVIIAQSWGGGGFRPSPWLSQKTKKAQSE